jgi:hypothetical protein
MKIKLLKEGKIIGHRYHVQRVIGTKVGTNQHNEADC